MSHQAVSWNLYRELRRPLHQIEAKFNTVQVEPLLSIPVEPFDPLSSCQPKKKVVTKKNDRVSAPSTRAVRSATSVSKHWRMPCDPANSTSDNRVEVNGESILYAIHPKRDEDTDVAVTKYKWDSETMRYMQCKSSSRRAASAPAAVPNTSLHLQKLFKAVQQSDSSSHFHRPQRSLTAKARWNPGQGLLHNSERTTQQSTDNVSCSFKQSAEKLDAEKLTPLSFEQAALANKVIPICGEKNPEPLKNNYLQSMSETIPVVFNKGYTPKPYTPSHSSRRPDGFIVHQEKAETIGLCGRKTPITKLEITQLNVDEIAEETNDMKESPKNVKFVSEDQSSAKPDGKNSNQLLAAEEQCGLYDEPCLGKEQTTNDWPCLGEEQTTADELSVGKEQTTADKQYTAQMVQKKQRPASRYKFSFNTSQSAHKERVKTPKLPEEVRSHIVRQCTMPSYAVMHQPQGEGTEVGDTTPSTKAIAVERFTETKDRVKNATKPVYHSFVERNTVKTTPTITSNGPPGSKIFMSITMPKDTLLNRKINRSRKKDNSHSQQMTQSPHKPTSQEIQQLLINSSKKQNKNYSRALSASRGRSITLTPKRTSLTDRKSSRSSAQEKITARDEHSPSARHVDVNIPTAGEAFSPGSTVSYSSSDDIVSRSCDLDDVRSEDSDLASAPLPPTPVPEKEDIETMKQRVRQDLMKTLSETEQFLQAMDEKRKNKPPQIVYSDDEEILPQKIDQSFAHDFVNAGAGEQARDYDDEHHNLPGADVDLNDFSDEPSISELSLPNSEQKLTAGQQYIQLVHQLEADMSVSADGKSDNGSSAN